MKTLRGLALVLTAAAVGLALAASATGKASSSAAKTRHIDGRIEALAMDENRIAYDVGPKGVANKVLVWNVKTGKTTAVSGKHTRTVDDSSTGSGVFALAVAGTRVAWLANVGGNSEGDDYLFESSVVKPRETTVATVMRTGDACPGRGGPLCAGGWLGGLVGSGGTIALNRWTTGAANQGSVTGAELDLLVGTKLKPVATGSDTLQAASADASRVAVLRPDGTVGLYASTGTLLRTIAPSSAEAVALSGHNLVVLTRSRTLELYNTQTGNRRKTLPAHGSARTPVNLDVQGNIAIYTTGSLHAVNLSSGKDRAIGSLRGGVGLARMSTAGVAYGTGRFRSKGTLVFLPWARVAASVS
jgi:hypothetical protein